MNANTPTLGWLGAGRMGAPVIAVRQRDRGVPAPHNAWVTVLAGRVERGELAITPDNLGLLLSPGLTEGEAS